MKLLKKKQQTSKKQELSAQDLIQIQALDGGYYVSDDMKVITGFKVGAINIELLSRFEIKNLMKKYEAFLHSVTDPIQEQTVSQPIDLGRFVEEKEEQLSNTTNEHRRKLLESYIKYSKGFESSRRVMRRQRYLLFYEELRENNQKAYEDARKYLEEKAFGFSVALKDMDLDPEPLTSLEIARLYHIMFDYEGALNLPLESHNISPIITCEEEE